MSERKLPQGWDAIGNDEIARAMEGRLREEVRHPDHPLFRKTATAIALGGNGDDVLFELDDGGLAWVHLTWAALPRKDRASPHTTVHDDFESWYRAAEADPFW